MGSGLVPLTLGEIRRLLAHLTTPSPNLTTALHWSTWRRRHQYQAKQAHYQRRHRLHHEVMLEYYATDLTLIGPALRPEAGLSPSGNGTVFLSAVTSHTLWFHRPVRSDTWLALHQHSLILAAGRIFGRGDILTEQGELVVSYAQEALFRPRSG
ncbi:thioesterase family protein [Streptomyces gardneri]|nr:thioesterase family protein [Streptomyces gardneri]